MIRAILALAIGMLFTAPALAQNCRASYYGAGEKLASHTASGERFRAHGLTAAHRTYPFGTLLRVSWRGNSVIVRVNDRGPHRATGRCLDLSRGAAAKLGMIRAGVAHVHIEKINNWRLWQ